MTCTEPVERAMPDRDGSTLVPWEPDPDTVIRLGWTIAILGFLVAIVSGVGELLGWWDLVGEIGLTVGSILGVVATLTTATFTASRDQAEALLDAHERHGRRLDAIDGTLGSMDGKLDKLDDLDAVQVELDRQTGVLEQQLEALRSLGGG